MEEILASIRRIISEDGTPAAADGAGAAQPSAPAPAPAPTAAPTPTAPAAAGGDDVLVLTEMVAEDGSVVSLPTKAAPPPPMEEVSAEAGGAEALPEPPEVEPVPEPLEPEPEPEAPAPEPAMTQEEEGEPMAEAASAPKPALVSDTTAAASTAALATLARTVAREKMAVLGGGRTVDDLARDALEPMLKEWLDANLAALVERLVREEIERMVQRIKP